MDSTKDLTKHNEDQIYHRMYRHHQETQQWQDIGRDWREIKSYGITKKCPGPGWCILIVLLAGM